MPAPEPEMEAEPEPRLEPEPEPRVEPEPVPVSRPEPIRAIAPGANATGGLLTVEALAYAAAMVLGAAWRLGNLGGYPLSGGEIREALAAWHQVAPAAAGSAPASSSPLLLIGNVLSMGLLGASDLSARLFVALCGVALVLVPLLYRRWLGRSGAVATGFLIAISPVAVAASRTVSSEMPVALFASIALGAALNRLAAPGDGGARPAAGHWSGLALYAAVAVGLALSAGPGIFTVLVLMAFAALAWTGLSGGARAEWRERLAALRAAGDLQPMVLFALVTLVLVSTGFFMIPGGLGIAAGMVPAWLAAFVPGSASGAVGGLFNHLLMLVVYEPMLVILGVAGLAWQWRRAGEAAGGEGEDRARHWLTPVAAWLFVALLLSLVRPGRAPGEVLWLTLPLAGLGGALLGEAFDGRRAMQMPLITWGLAAAMLLIGIVAGVLVLTYGKQLAVPSAGQVPALVFFPWMLLLTVIIQVLLAAAMVVWDRASWRAVALAAALPLGVYACSAAYGVANLRATSPAEPWVTAPTSARVYTFLDVLRDVSVQKTGTVSDVPITVEGSPDGVLGWYLRDYEHVTYVDLLAPATNTEVVITADTVISPTVATAYTGADFVLRDGWLPPGGEQLGEVLGWMLMRSGGMVEHQEGVVLWRVAPVPERPAEEPSPVGGEVIP